MWLRSMFLTFPKDICRHFISSDQVFLLLFHTKSHKVFAWPLVQVKEDGWQWEEKVRNPNSSELDLKKKKKVKPFIKKSWNVLRYQYSYYHLTANVWLVMDLKKALIFRSNKVEQKGEKTPEESLMLHLVKWGRFCYPGQLFCPINCHRLAFLGGQKKVFPFTEGNAFALVCTFLLHWAQASMQLLV